MAKEKNANGFNSIQEKMNRLDEIIIKLQSEEGSLEEKIELYKEGKKLSSELTVQFKDLRQDID